MKAITIILNTLLLIAVCIGIYMWDDRSSRMESSLSHLESQLSDIDRQLSTTREYQVDQQEKLKRLSQQISALAETNYCDDLATIERQLNYIGQLLEVQNRELRNQTTNLELLRNNIEREFMLLRVIR